MALSAADLESVITADPALRAWWELRQRELGWARFQPRPDQPDKFDQQSSFCNNRDKVAFLIGGNAAGTTEAAAFKTAQFLLRQQPPPRPNTPFWIISNSYEQVCDVCWTEKLEGHGHIPGCEVEWDAVTWHNARKNQPQSVPLKPWPREALEAWENGSGTRGVPGGQGSGLRPNVEGVDEPTFRADAKILNPEPRTLNSSSRLSTNNNWLIEFKSYEQGRRALQARSIGGFWFSEQFPLDLFLEVLRGCREYMFPGGQFAEFTPIEPELCLWIEKIMDQIPKGWAFYRANTACNKPNLAAGWFEDFFGTVPDEMISTRMTGALATFEGVIYQSFNPAVHVVDEPEFPAFPPRGVWHFRGVDWGASEEHPFTCVWGYRDGAGDWWVYDEYWNNSQTAITGDHIDEIKSRWAGLWRDGDPHFGATFADPSRPGEMNAFNRAGIECAPAANDVFKGIDLVRSLLKVNPKTRQPRLRIHKKRCPHLIEEMRKYRWLKGKRSVGGTILNPKVAQPVPLKRDDDTVDALRYLLYSATLRDGAVPGSTKFSRDTAQRAGVQLDRGGNRGGWHREEQ